MKRKEFLRNAAIAGAGLFAAPLLSRAAEGNSVLSEKNSQFQTTISIASNHGHILELDLDGIVTALQSSRANGSITIDIQGESRHPHLLQLTQLELIQLLSDGLLEKDSSVDRGHSHTVRLELIQTA